MMSLLACQDRKIETSLLVTTQNVEELPSNLDTNKNDIPCVTTSSEDLDRGATKGISKYESSDYSSEQEGKKLAEHSSSTYSSESDDKHMKYTMPDCDKGQGKGSDTSSEYSASNLDDKPKQPTEILLGEEYEFQL